MTTDVKYYGIPGRGEAVRLMLKLKGTKYTETYIDSKTWKAGEKENTKWNVMPVITLENGQVAGMSRSILRYIAKTTYVEGNPLYPTDPNDALVVDEMTKETNAQSLFTGRPKLSAICTRVGALAAVKAHQTDANNKIAMKQAYMTAPWSSKL